jgi:hypothetical protein
MARATEAVTQLIYVHDDQPFAAFELDVANGLYRSPAPYRLALSLPGRVRASDVRGPALLGARLDWQVLEGKRWRVVSVSEINPPDARKLLLNAGQPDEDLINFTVILARAPRSDRAGGARGAVGRKVLAAGEETEAHSITLPASVWREIERIGEGNRSEGVRRLAESRPREADAIPGPK